MPESDERNDGALNDLFGSLPTARSPLADLQARSAPAPGSRRALREATQRDAAAREAIARQAAERRSAENPAPHDPAPYDQAPIQQAPIQPAPVQPAAAPYEPVGYPTTPAHTPTHEDATIPASDAPAYSGAPRRSAAHDAGIAALMAPSTATWPIPVQNVPASPVAEAAAEPQTPEPQTPEPQTPEPQPVRPPLWQQASEQQAAPQAREQQFVEQQATEPDPVASLWPEPAEAEAPGDDETPGGDEPGSVHALFAPERHHDVPKKKRGRGCLVGVIVMLVILGGIAAGGAWVWNQYGDKISDMMGWGEPKDYEAGIANGEALVTIKTGDTGGSVSTALYNAKVTKTDSVFYDYLIAEGKAITFYPGVYKLQQQMTAAAALEALENPANRMENTVSVAEGGTVAATLPRIVDGIGIPLEELQAAVKDPKIYGVQADTLEGWLFPAVYTFDPGATAQDVIKAMVDRTQESLKAAGVAPADAQRILTIASIVQREGHTADFDKVSRVIENRLDPANDETHGLLQMDSTAQYGYGLTHEGPVSSWPWDAVVNDQNPWNTYAHAGLPTSPISNPSDAAIKAAQNPADGPWFYFVTVNLDTGETVFSATYAEQQAAEAKYRQWCEDNPDGGCY